VCPLRRSLRCQNLVLLVDNGQVTDAVRHADSGEFGKTGDTTYVWRSGIGIRADGNIVTVHGNALSGKTLTELLVRGGAGTGDAARHQA